MEKYFRAIGVEDDATKANTTSIYFSNVALMWWHRKYTNEKRGETTIETWEQFQKEFNQLYPQYVDEARAKLRWLTQQGTVWEYVRDFN